MVVLDASGVLNAFGFRFDRKFYTTPSVMEEIKDLRSRAIVESGTIQGKLMVLLPSKESLEKVREAARKLGFEKKLSKTDMDIIALALDLKDELWTDDKTLAKLANKLGIKTSPIIWK